jgi:molybdate transport system ATP-binding protein
MYPRILLSLRNITVRLRTSLFFENTSWKLYSGEHWLIVGSNGAGKTTFAKALAGLVPLKFGEIKRNGKVSYVSFDTEQQFLEKEERKKDFASYVGKEKKGKTVKDFLGRKRKEDLIEHFGLGTLLNREVATLSTGEMRKVFLVKTLLSKPKVLILDEPLNGLDVKSRKNFVRFLDKLAIDLQIILVTHDVEEIPKAITHVMVIEDGKIAEVGMKKSLDQLSFPRRRESSKTKKASVTDWIPDQVGNDNSFIIQMKNVSVQFGIRKILDNVNWTVKLGENWAILGPNGAGKSTLVKLITGDSLQVHANDIEIFGKRRTELPLFELRKHIGYVSAESHLRNNKITNLSQGQKRLLLIERELKKSPKLLILDEPCQHLDMKNKAHVLELVDQIGRSGKTSILLITHNKTEIVPSISHVLQLDKGKAVVVQ